MRFRQFTFFFPVLLFASWTALADPSPSPPILYQGQLDSDTERNFVAAPEGSRAGQALLKGSHNGVMGHMVFNLTGGVNGFGDVTGPLWILLDLKKANPKASFSAVVDDYSMKVLKEMYQFGDLKELEAKLGVNFVEMNDATKLKPADYSFEMFAGGRKLNNFTQHPYVDDRTVSIISDTMHGSTLDEIRLGDSHLYFNPPGIGSSRSGILNNPDLKMFLNKDIKQRRRIAAKAFKGHPIKSLLNRERFSEAKLGFLYGAHNTIWHQELAEQTSRYLNTVKKYNSPGSPLIVFTPNKRKDLEKLLPADMKALDPEELMRLDHLENKVYLVSLGSLSNLQYTGLLASSDTPVLVEGNSSVSSALRLNVPFVMYRSPWNAPQIQDLIHVENTFCQSNDFGEIYDFSKLCRPIFEDFLPTLEESEKSRTLPSKKEVFYQSLNVRIPNFPDKVDFLIESHRRAKSFEFLSPEERDSSYWKLSEDIARVTRDAPFEYSTILDAFKHRLVSESLLKRKQKDLALRGIDYKDLEKRFVEKIPNPNLGVPICDGKTNCNLEPEDNDVAQAIYHEATPQEFDADLLKKSLISNLGHALRKSKNLDLVGQDPINRGQRAEVYQSIDRQGKMWAVKVLLDAERSDLIGSKLANYKKNSIFLSEENNVFEVLRKNGFKNNVPKSSLFNNYTLIKEFVKGKTLFQLLRDDQLNPHMELQLLTLFKSLCAKNLYVTDLHGHNLIYSETSNEWVIIDSDGVVENAPGACQSYTSELNRHWNNDFKWNKNPKILENLHRIKPILLDKLMSGNAPGVKPLH